MDSGTSYHMDTTEDILSSLNACNGPPILIGDDSPIEGTRKRRVELYHGIFENVLHFPQFSMNMLSVYQNTH
jgi:hypothetical protein